jgi:hypothetical protein
MVRDIFQPSYPPKQFIQFGLALAVSKQTSGQSLRGTKGSWPWYRVALQERAERKAESNRLMAIIRRVWYIPYPAVTYPC